MQSSMLINGKFVAGQDASEKIINPATGEFLLDLPEASPEDIQNAVDAAERAFVKWSRTTPAERAGMLLQLADRIEAEAEEFARLESINCGKPYHLVLEDEIPAVVDCLRFLPVPPAASMAAPPVNISQASPQ